MHGRRNENMRLGSMNPHMLGRPLKIHIVGHSVWALIGSRFSNKLTEMNKTTNPNPQHMRQLGIDKNRLISQNCSICISMIYKGYILCF